MWKLSCDSVWRYDVLTSPSHRPTISILYVEDEQVTRSLLSRMIAKRFPDAKFYLAENGSEGLELYREHRPDIVITDVNMPVMDGLTMAAAIKSINPAAQIIVISAYSQGEFLEKAGEAGIIHYLLKPVNSRVLFATIDRCIADISPLSRERDVT